MTIARAGGSATFPAAFTLVAARNPCPCGRLDDPDRPCTRLPSEVARYRRRLSGSLLDRVDLEVSVPRLESRALLGGPCPEASGAVRDRVARARRRQLRRLGPSTPAPSPGAFAPSAPWLPAPACNAAIPPSAIRRLCRPTAGAARLLEAGMRRRDLSARAAHRVLRVACTIADLDDSDEIQDAHVAEALQYHRPADGP